MSERESELGKIKSVTFGHGGYQDCMIGISFDLGGDSSSVGDFWGAWFIERSKSAEWTEESRTKLLGEMVMRISKLLEDAKVTRVQDLEGIPIRIYWKNFNHLDRWEILKEVL